MKKTTLILFPILLFSLASYAQLDKNTWLNSGALNFFSSKKDYTSYATPNTSGYSNDVNLTVSFSTGYFVTDKVAFGLKPYFSWAKSESFTNDPNSSGVSGSTKRYGIGPFFRYYFLQKEKQFNILTDMSYQVGRWDSGGLIGPIKDFNISAGPVIYFNSSVGMEFLLGYKSHLEVLKDYSKSVSKGLNLSIGFQIHLKKY